jgi:hypothetical protein
MLAYFPMEIQQKLLADYRHIMLTDLLVVMGFSNS